MKTTFSLAWRLFMTILLSLSCVSFSSCDDDKDNNEDMIWDIAPVEVSINIQNAAGQNLLSPSVAGNLQGKKITAIYEGKEYDLSWDATEDTRAYLAFFSGLTLKCDYKETGDSFEPNPDTNYLSFGEFNGDENQDISIALRIEGYTESWNIDVAHRIKWNNKRPKITDTASVNGTKTNYYNIVITL